jgi:hypothetical protein
VLEDFKRALARLQSDYGFYVDCQANPAVALAGYDLTPDERSALTDPAKLADVLRGGVGVERLRPITVKISGSHDWVNRAAAASPSEDAATRVSVGREVDAVKRAKTREGRIDASVRLMGLIG